MISFPSFCAFIAAFFAFLISGSLFPADGAGRCKQTSKATFKSANFKAKSEYWADIANCNNISNSKDRKPCLSKAKKHLKDAEE